MSLCFEVSGIGNHLGPLCCCGWGCSVATTTTTGENLESEGWPLTDGDLGINLLISGFPYGAFVVGKNYLFGATLVQITEPIQPCGYLCTLPFLKTKKSCEQFLKTLKGRRGWYAKVLTPGQISVGDAALALWQYPQCRNHRQKSKKKGGVGH